MDERFLRNEMLWGKDGQARLTAAHVIVFGLGGVGSYVAECLARAGVGELTLVDSDTVALSNLNRQLEALDSTVGLPKAEAVVRRVRDINPYAVLHPMEALYNADNREQFFPAGCRYDYIVDAIDLVSCKLDLAETARRLGVPLIMALGTGNKLDPSLLRLADISETYGCPLARVMRKELRNRGPLWGLSSGPSPAVPPRRSPPTVSAAGSRPSSCRAWPCAFCISASADVSRGRTL